MTAQVHHGDALDAYSEWGTPDAIISDGAYGINGFDGDPKTVDSLREWYRPHVEAWSQYAHPGTSLWFWNTEIGWATVHPLLEENGWEYVQTVVWNKGIGHVAGNVNSSTIRSLPVVTEISVLYRLKPVFILKDGAQEGDDENSVGSMQEWLRSEWKRSRLPLAKANEACGVKSAATRKWLTRDPHWYAPDADAVQALAAYCNQHGDPAGAPYFELDGAPITQSRWNHLRAQWHHVHGLTNVWEHPAVRNGERHRGSDGSFLHTNQKPLELMRRQIESVSSAGDVVWEPFGGLCSASVASAELGRTSHAAEPNKDFVDAARNRIAAQQNGNTEPTGTTDDMAS